MCVDSAVGLRSDWRGLWVKTLLPRRNDSGHRELYLQWHCIEIGGVAGARRRLDAVLTDGEVVVSVDSLVSGAAKW